MRRRRLLKLSGGVAGLGVPPPAGNMLWGAANVMLWGAANDMNWGI